MCIFKSVSSRVSSLTIVASLHRTPTCIFTCIFVSSISSPDTSVYLRRVSSTQKETVYLRRVSFIEDTHLCPTDKNPRPDLRITPRRRRHVIESRRSATRRGSPSTLMRPFPPSPPPPPSPASVPAAASAMSTTPATPSPTAVAVSAGNRGGDSRLLELRPTPTGARGPLRPVGSLLPRQEGRRAQRYARSRPPTHAHFGAWRRRRTHNC